MPWGRGASLSPGQEGHRGCSLILSSTVSPRAPSLLGNSHAFSLSALTCFGGQTSQTAPWGWDRGLVSLPQVSAFPAPWPLEASSCCPLTLPPSGASPGQKERARRLASARLAPLKGRWPQVQVGEQVSTTEAFTVQEPQLQPGQSALCSSESGPLRFFTEQVRSVCPTIASLTQHLACQVRPGVAHPGTACLRRLKHSHCGQTRLSFLLVRDGRLDCSHSWAFVNNAAVGCRVSTRSRL